MDDTEYYSKVSKKLMKLARESDFKDHSCDLVEGSVVISELVAKNEALRKCIIELTENK